VGDSPVVPTGTRPCVPCSTCQSTRRRSVASSTRPCEKGVTSATSDPEILLLTMRLLVTGEADAEPERKTPGAAKGCRGWIYECCCVYRGMATTRADTRARLGAAGLRLGPNAMVMTSASWPSRRRASIARGATATEERQ